MKRWAVVPCLVITVASMLVKAAEPVPGREFEATARVTTRQGSRTMTFTLLASRYTSLDDASHLAELLASGGQGAVPSSLKGRNDGILRLGVLVATPAQTRREHQDGEQSQIEVRHDVLIHDAEARCQRAVSPAPLAVAQDAQSTSGVPGAVKAPSPSTSTKMGLVSAAGTAPGARRV